MRFFFHEETEEEFDRAVQYYEEQRPGLGLEFAEEVYGAVARRNTDLALHRPAGWRPITARGGADQLESRLKAAPSYLQGAEYVPGTFWISQDGSSLAPGSRCLDEALSVPGLRYTLAM